MKAVVDILIEVATANADGFTFSLRAMRKVNNGIAVAYEATQNTFGFEHFPTVIAHAMQHDLHVGGWQDGRTGLFYLDSVRLFPESELEAALAFGRANGQLSIFILSEQRTIFL